MLTSAPILIGVVLISAVCVFQILRAPVAPGRLAIALSGISALWWIGTVLLRLNIDDLNTKILLCELSWFGIVGTPLFWCIGFLNYAGYTWIRSPKYLHSALAVTVFAGITALSNEHHHAIYTGLTNLQRPTFSHGWLYFALLGAIYLCLLTASIAAFTKLVRSSGLHRLQFLGVLTAMALPWAANLAFNLFEFRILNDDPTPFAFAATAVIMLVVQTKAKLFSAPPIARDVIFAILPDPVIVLDQENTILEVNPAAMKLAGLGPKPIGSTLPQNHPLTEVCTVCAAVDDGPSIIYMPESDQKFEVSQRKLDQWGRKACRLLVLRDVTEREAARHELEAVGADLKLRLEENLRLQARLQDEATHDHLTGLYNRRHASTSALKLIEKATPSARTSVVLIDLDFFKQVNDRFGHDAGDEVLVSFARLLKQSFRPQDMAFRYGGEEFLMVLPGCDKDAALQRCQALRSAFAELSIPQIENFDLNFSAGLALAPDAGSTLDDCVKAADIALYRAKISGRGQDVVWGDHLKGMPTQTLPARKQVQNKVA